MHQSENMKIKFITIINKYEFSWLILLFARVNENQYLNHGGGGKPKTYRQAPTYWLRNDHHLVWGPNRRRAIKEWSIAINND